MKSNENITKKELRKFGIVMAVPLCIIAVFLFWKEKPSAVFFLITSLFFLGSALFFPAILKPVEKIWMKIASMLSAIMTRVILTITYFLIITPMGLVIRLFGKDLLKKKIKPGAESYWIPVEKDGPGTRPEKPY